MNKEYSGKLSGYYISDIELIFLIFDKSVNEGSIGYF
jgi:hypothetical protein